MKVIVVALIAVCVIGTSLGEDCSAQIQSFHQCIDQSHQQAKEQYKAKFQAIKAKLDACYTNNGCQPPAARQPGQGRPGGKNATRNETKGACQKAFHQQLKSNIEACVKKANPGVSLPPHNKKQGHDWKPQGGYDHKRQNQDLANCTNKQAVRACKRDLFNSSKPSQQEKQAAFEARCNAKQQCLAKMSSACQQQLQNLKKSFCQCRQQAAQQADQIRNGIPACSGAQPKQGRHQQQKEHSCEEKDYCKLGYAAFEADHQKKKGNRKGKGKGNGHHENRS